MTTWIEQTARRKSLASIVLFAIVTTVIALIVSADNGEYWRGLLHPVSIDVSQLQADGAMVDNLQHLDKNVVTVTGEPVGSTGVQEVSSYEGFLSQVTADYSALRIGSRLLIVKSAKQPGTTVTGLLSVMPYELETKLFPEGTDPSVKSRVYPLLLDTDYREPAETMAFWTVLLEGIFGFMAWRGWRRLSGRVEHPAVKRARGWGALETISAQVNHERQNAVRCRTRGWTLTDNYLVLNTMLRLNVFRMEDLVWAYPRQIKRRLWHVIPIGFEHEAVMHFRDGTSRVNGKKASVNQVLELARTRAPWAIIGYTEDLEQAWRMHKDDLIAKVIAKKS